MMFHGYNFYVDVAEDGIVTIGFDPDLTPQRLGFREGEYYKVKLDNDGNPIQQLVKNPYID